MSEFESKKGQEFKVDDVFFKDNFDITDIEDNIYNQMAKTIARNVDIELAKTPLVDILTGYTRYKEAEYELQQKDKEIERLNNIINEFDKWLEEESEKTILSTGHLTCLMMCKNKLQELKRSDKQ